MARDRSAAGTGSRFANARSGLGNLPVTIGADHNHGFLSGWRVVETGGSTAAVNIRDAVLPPTAPTLVDGAAGSDTAGVHYGVVTYVTANGEGVIGAQSASLTSAGSKHITWTVPTAPTNLKDPVIGRNLYITKAGAPAASSTPTNAQWFLVATALSTTIGAGSNAQRVPDLPTSGSTLTTFTLTVAATASFAAAGNLAVACSFGTIPVAYTAIGSGTTFTGCTSEFAGAVFTTGGTVTQPTIGDNTTTTYDFNIADGSLGSTNPPAVDKTGQVVVPIKLSAGQSGGDTYGNNIDELSNGGGVYVEIPSGAVQWTIRGGP